MDLNDDRWTSNGLSVPLTSIGNALSVPGMMKVVVKEKEAGVLMRTTPNLICD